MPAFLLAGGLFRLSLRIVKIVPIYAASGWSRGCDRMDAEGNRAIMQDPATQSLLETVRKINHMARKMRSGEPGIEDYLREITADPATEWFTQLLREKNQELENERKHSDLLVSALKRWARQRKAVGSEAGADSQLLDFLLETGIIEE